MSVVVYKYRLAAPSVSEPLIRDQMRLAHQYRNTLVTIERGRRAAIRAAEHAVGDLVRLAQDVASATAAVTAAVEAIKTQRASTRTRSDTQEMRAAATAARARKREAVRTLREARARVRADGVLAQEYDRINELAGELQRNARAHCGVYWGTYLLIEAEMQAARNMPLYDGADPNDPAYVRWTGEASLGVQIQQGITTDRVLSGADDRDDDRRDRNDLQCLREGLVFTTECRETPGDGRERCLLQCLREGLVFHDCAIPRYGESAVTACNEGSSHAPCNACVKALFSRLVFHEGEPSPNGSRPTPLFFTTRDCTTTVF